MLNNCILMGRLTHTPELYTLKSGKNVLRFSLAVNRPKIKNEEVKTDFIDCIAWDKTAEFINKYFQKGDALILEGKIETRDSKDKQGTVRKVTEVIAREIHFCDYAKKKDKPDNQSNQETFDDMPF